MTGVPRRREGRAEAGEVASGEAGLRLVRERLRDGANPPIAKLIGFELIDAGPGSATVELVAGPRHANPMGTLHGGILCDIADAAMGIAYATTLSEGESFTTMELKANFLKPVWTGRIFARATVLKKGRSTGLVTCRVEDDEGKLVAFTTGTCMTIASDEGSGLGRRRRRKRMKKRDKRSTSETASAGEEGEGRQTVR